MKGFIIIIFLYSKTLDGSSICDNNPCRPNGACSVSVSSPGYKCSCYPGFIPPNCDDRDECSMASNLCQNGTCTNNPGSYSCICNTGYTGVHCEKQTDPCLLNPCENGGTCQPATDGTFLCKCFAGFDSNYNCRDINECSIASSTCHNGTCQNTLGSFKCLCNSGYQGVHCTRDINECDKHPCNNNSACVNNAGSYKCMCYRGYGGSDCVDRDECSLSTSICSHGTCVNTPGSFKCVCQNGYSGPRCKEDINECLNSPCINGLCVNTEGSFQCKCNNGFQGKLCEEKIIVTSTTVKSTTSKQTTHKVSLLLSSIFAFSSTSHFEATSAKTMKTSLVRTPPTSTVPAVTSKTFLPTSDIHASVTSSSSSSYLTVSKVYSPHSVQKPDITTSPLGNSQVADSWTNMQTTRNSSPWAQNHWYIFVLVGVVLITGILVSLVVVKKRLRKASGFTRLNGSLEVTSTSTVKQIQAENPLYMEFHGHDSGASDL
ncbi:protein crumbs homolog 1-like [Ruditapes philippinarum]|uniref:protein crumbs homolog 1-like n=1 Tax=Ruditapes philippinarum TaxID=129788 RepID=UPI00295B53F6|nr:protein crumbs homolog 1-like [Ruditapes philippinarum]